MLLKRLSATAALFIAISATALAQSSSINGEITGTVTDSAGGVVANAKVGATNQGTGFTQTGVTTENGLYRFGLLPLGTYDIRVEAPGFAPVKQTGVTVNAGATVTVDVRLEVK